MSDLPLFQFVLTLAIMVTFLIANRLNIKIMNRLGAYKGVPESRVINVQKYFKTLMFLIALIGVLAIWGVDYRGVLIFASSIIAVLGVALFAQWSLLSNITAGVIIFFAFPARIGDKIEIIDGSDVITGTIIEINIFQMLLRDENGFDISYPNNLVLQRPVRRLLATREVQKDHKTSVLKSRFKGRG
ncbi:mechanosensitive ion channel domain-containing protein [Thiomicrorhabdus arctica]|uniref:mechanosensitive ion channel domain-containing protein n=1 Tax=Thiomicrorhabdus arctica TaxID=131540 RepID=UPI0003727134|nr:mechanosensitive ion channel domain-containing protein [Thiomicrorhabdus arctica]